MGGCLLAFVITTLGLALGALGWFADAEPSRAHVFAREAGDRQVEGLAQSQFGRLHNIQGRIGETLADTEAALALHRDLRRRGLEGAVLGEVANLHVWQGALKKGRRRAAGR